MILIRLLTLSAISPPTGDNRIAGTKAHAITVPYSTDEPVQFNKYNGNANRMAALPKSEMISDLLTATIRCF